MECEDRATPVLLLLAFAAALIAAPAAAQERPQARSKRSPPSRSSAIWCAMSAAIASTSRRWSARTATPTSIRRRPATPETRRGRHGLRQRLGLEGWMTRLVAASGTKAPTIVVTNGVAPRQMEDEERSGRRTAIDPHAWQSVANAKIYVANIRDGLIADRSRGQNYLRRQRRGLSRQARRAGKRGQSGDRQNSRRSPQDHHHPRCLRLFRRRLRHGLHRAGRRLDRSRAVGEGRGQDHHADQGAERFRRCFWRTSPTRA